MVDARITPKMARQIMIIIFFYSVRRSIDDDDDDDESKLKYEKCTLKEKKR